MARVEATELVAYGVTCDTTGCERVERVRNAQSRPVGWFAMTLRRDYEKTHYASDELWFCSKNCLLEAMQWQLSALLNPVTP